MHLELDEPVTDIAYSPAGDLAIAAGRHVVLATSAGTARIAASRGDEDRARCVAFRDARTLAIASTESGLRIIELGSPPRVTHIATTCHWHTMRWSLDGNYIAGGQYEPWVSIIDVAARSELRVLDPDEFDDSGRTALVFSAATLYSTAYNKLVRWRWPEVITNKAKCRAPKTGVTGHVHLWDLAELADGSLAALADCEGDGGFVQRFSPTGERIGKRLAVACGTGRILAVGDRLLLMQHDEPLQLLALDGSVVKTFDYPTALGELKAIATLAGTLAIGGTRGVATIDVT
jgi:hypothetical protein